MKNVIWNGFREIPFTGDSRLKALFAFGKGQALQRENLVDEGIPKSLVMDKFSKIQHWNFNFTRCIFISDMYHESYIEKYTEFIGQRCFLLHIHLKISMDVVIVYIIDKEMPLLLDITHFHFEVNQSR